MIPRQIDLDEDKEVEMIMSKSLDSAESASATNDVSNRSKSEPTFHVTRQLPEIRIKERRQLFLTVENVIFENGLDLMQLSEPPSKLKMILIWLSVVTLIFAITIGSYFYS